MSDKDQRVAVITGGSRGIGAGLVVAEQPRRRAPRGGERHELVEQERARHPGLIDEHDVARVEGEGPGEARRRRAAAPRTARRSTRRGTCAGCRP
jgi:hypothetical protein